MDVDDEDCEHAHRVQLTDSVPLTISHSAAFAGGRLVFFTVILNAGVTYVTALFDPLSSVWVFQWFTLLSSPFRLCLLPSVVDPSARALMTI